MDEDLPDRQGPQWGNFLLVFHPSCLALICTAVGTVMAAAFRALKHDLDMQQSGVSHAEGAITLDHKQALAIPIFSSCALLILFYFFQAIQLFLLVILCCASVVAITFALHPLLEAAAATRPNLRRRLVFCSNRQWQVQVGEALLGAGAVLSVFLWIITGSMFLNNILGICLCITFISFVRLPSLKITTMLLCALFCYDIFWVFCSKMLFGHNVMVEAATKQAENPAKVMAEALHLPSAGIAEQLDLPVKLMFPLNLLHWDRKQPGLMLGLGDMALPGMLIALLLCEDVAKWKLVQGGGSGGSNIIAISGKSALRSWQFWRQSYTLSSWTGYSIGMFLALGIGTVFQAAQPALLYLVPLTLLPAVVQARRNKELKTLWDGWEYEQRKESAV